MLHARGVSDVISADKNGINLKILIQSFNKLVSVRLL
jgi:hypothetical protein